MDHIISGIYLSGLGPLYNEVPELDQINTVVSFLSSPRYKRIVSNACKLRGMRHYIFDLEDSPDADIAQHFDKIYSILVHHVQQGDKVLVHCHAGVSRSATAVLAYLIKSGMSFDDAFALVRSKRDIAPNIGFLQQLHKL